MIMCIMAKHLHSDLQTGKPSDFDKLIECIWLLCSDNTLDLHEKSRKSFWDTT